MPGSSPTIRRRMNALTAAMWQALPGHIKTANGDPEVRVIVLRGAGTKAFSAGADISEFESARTGDAAKIYDTLNDNAFTALISCPKPTIAMIHGFCLGGGLGLALCCDLRIGDDASQYAIPAAKLGIGYNARWIRPILAAVPPARAKELLFTGRRFRVGGSRSDGPGHAVSCRPRIWKRPCGRWPRRSPATRRCRLQPPSA